MGKRAADRKHTFISWFRFQPYLNNLGNSKIQLFLYNSMFSQLQMPAPLHVQQFYGITLHFTCCFFYWPLLFCVFTRALQEVSEPTKEEKAVAKYLRFNCPTKSTNMMGHRVDYFIG